MEEKVVHESWLAVVFGPYYSKKREQSPSIQSVYFVVGSGVLILLVLSFPQSFSILNSVL